MYILSLVKSIFLPAKNISIHWNQQSYIEADKTEYQDVFGNQRNGPGNLVK